MTTPEKTTPSKITMRKFVPSPSPKQATSGTDFHGYVGAVGLIKLNREKTRKQFYVHFKTGPTIFQRILVNNHPDLTGVRQELLSYFHNKEPVSIMKLNKGNGLHFFNKSSYIEEAKIRITFDLNEADSYNLSTVDGEGSIPSIIGKIKFLEKPNLKTYEKNNKQRTDKKRECLIHDGTASMKITFWNDMIDIIRENQLLQLTNLVAKQLSSDEIVLGTDFSTSVCFLSTDIDVTFNPIEIDHSVEEKTVTIKSVLAIKANTFLSCLFCNNKVNIQTGTGMCSCSSKECGKIFSVDKLTQNSKSSSITVMIDFFDSKDEIISSKVYGDVLNTFFGESTVKDLTTLKQSILDLENINVVINTRRNVITSIN
ncbi:uncharacterized protein [Clytia hemisphaerica]|uniref:Uncharacterized protein n=3 Tax=Clytia hemisphaerica TaxID=252671 RepID=A0A7M5WR25_9CNID